MLRLHSTRETDTGEICGRCGRQVTGKWYDADAYISNIYTGTVTRCQECWDTEIQLGNVELGNLPHSSISQAEAKRTPPTSTTPEPPHRPPSGRPLE